MDLCDFFQTDIQPIEDDRIDRNRSAGPRRVSEGPWCSHPFSPVTQDDTEVLGGGSKLMCRGDVARCQIRPELLDGAQSE